MMQWRMLHNLSRLHRSPLRRSAQCLSTTTTSYYDSQSGIQVEYTNLVDVHGLMQGTTGSHRLEGYNFASYTLPAGAPYFASGTEAPIYASASNAKEVAGPAEGVHVGTGDLA